MHLLERKIVLDVDTEQLWAFIATPANLNLLTPPELDFRIASEVPERMYNGLLIDYRISIPPFGIHRWLTEIKHINEGVSFVDEQRLGPYRLWYHYHEVTPLAATRTCMIDRVNYRLPFGPLGKIVHQLRVQRMLTDIFDYREKQLRRMFPLAAPAAIAS
jgi:ligand-binding SRPBCC domain-containing protein